MPGKSADRRSAGGSAPVPPMQQLTSLRELDERYDAILCDIWGVLHDGETLFAGVAELLVGLRGAGKVVVLVSNVPRPGWTLPRHLDALGLPAEAYDAIVTSGDVIRPELARRAPGPVHRLGRSGDEGLWDGLGLEFGPIGQAQVLAIAGLRAGETPADYADALRRARARDLTMLCANPDIQVQSGDGLAWCAGAIARDYGLLGGRVIQTGKPHAPIYARAREAVDRVAGRSVPQDRLLAIGDGIGTDIVGANRAGIDSVFVATGMQGDSLLTEGRVDLPRAEAALTAAGARATYVLTRFA